VIRMTPEEFEPVEVLLEQVWGDEYRRYADARRAWRAVRRREAAEVLGMPVEEVDDLAVGFAAAWHGRPDPRDPGPQFEPPA
jgi:hypothetical protein